MSDHELIDQLLFEARQDIEFWLDRGWDFYGGVELRPCLSRINAEIARRIPCQPLVRKSWR